MAGPTIVFQTGTHAGRPAADSGCVLYACTTHSKVYRSDGATWTDWLDATGGETLAATIIDAKGDLITGTAADTPARLAVGADDTILMADAAAGTGLKWAASGTPSTQALGDSAAVGTADTFTRGDHKHAMPAAAGTGDIADVDSTEAAGSAGTIARGDHVHALKAGLRDASVQIIIDGGGSAITTGVKGYIEVPFAGTITAVRLLADVSGSIVVDIWKDTYANYPPVDADSITASAVPTISSATKSQDTTLTGWTTSVSAGDILGFNVDSATTVTKVTVALTIRRT
jgi:hypothetical protein